MNVEPTDSPLLGEFELMAQFEKKANPSKLIYETSSETYTFREAILIDFDREVGEESPVVVDSFH